MSTKDHPAATGGSGGRCGLLSCNGWYRTRWAVERSARHGPYPQTQPKKVVDSLGVVCNNHT